MILFLILSCEEETFDNPVDPEAVFDCLGTFEGDVVLDCAGVCGGTLIPSGCDNVCNSTAVEDCAGVCGGIAVEDACGVCNGGNNNCIVDIDGNGYTTVIIGMQEWLVQNLKVTKYKDGSDIPTGLSSGTDGEWANTSEGAYAIYNDDPANADVYGNLYNWYAVVDERGVCPDGWHVPSDEEFMELEMELGMSESEAKEAGLSIRGTNEGSKLAGNADLWTNDDLENNSEFGTSGFNVLPAGYRHNGNGAYNNMGNFGFFWSSSEYLSNDAWYRGLYYFSSNVNRHYLGGKQDGFSIRCLGD